MTDSTQLHADLPEPDWLVQRLSQHGVTVARAHSIALVASELLGDTVPATLLDRLRQIPAATRTAPLTSALSAVDEWLAKAREWITRGWTAESPVAATVALRGHPSADRFRVKGNCGLLGLDVECERSADGAAWDLTGAITSPDEAPAGLVIRFTHDDHADSAGISSTIDDLAMFRARLPAGQYSISIGSPAQDAVPLASLSLP